MLPLCLERMFHYSINSNEKLMRIIIQNNENYEQTQGKSSILKLYVSPAQLMVSASFILIISEPWEPRGLLAVQPTPLDDTLHIQQWVWQIGH